MEKNKQHSEKVCSMRCDLHTHSVFSDGTYTPSEIIAEAKRLCNGTGNATFRNDLIDAVFYMTEEKMKEGVRYEVYKR